MAASAERMSRVDHAWLRMDSDLNLMMIVGVWLLTPAVTLETLRERNGSTTPTSTSAITWCVSDSRGAAPAASARPCRHVVASWP